MDMLKAFFGGFADRLRKRAKPARSAAGSDKGAAMATDIIKEAPIEIDGRCMTADEFVSYVEGLEFPTPTATRIFLHHTWKPTPDTWKGKSTILAMKDYYEKQQWTDSQGKVHEGWTAGPQLFVAQDGIWLFSDLRYDGVGVYGHNYRTRHLEMVGDYDNQTPSGAILQNTIAALGILHERLGLDITKLAFHRDFSSKTCPGKAVTKDWLIPQIEEWIAAYRQSKTEETPTLRQSLTGMVQDLFKPTNSQAALAKAAAARGLLGAVTNEVPLEIGGKGYITQLFVEALLVPVGQWNKVQSLKEYEQAPAVAVGPFMAAPGAAEEGAIGDHSGPPQDPYQFMGEVR